MDSDNTKSLEKLSWSNFNGQYPSSVQLAHFNQLSKVRNVQDELRLEGWQVLGERKKWWCAYRGVAFINQRRKQIVLAHRGTQTWNILNWISNLAVLFFYSTGFQLWQACLFADKVSKFALKNGYQLIITGHSMGGVLAQITAFSTKFLQVRNGTDFAVKDASQFGHFHPHVECFDSPGAYKVIRNLIAKYQAGIYVGSFDQAPSRLDVLNFVVSPNIPNTRGVHIGTVVCVDRSLLRRRSCCDWVGKHSLDDIVRLLKSENAFASKMTCWGETGQSHNEEFRYCIPDYCLTLSEIELIEYVQHLDVECRGIDFDGADILRKVRFETKGDKSSRVLHLPVEAVDSKFIPYVHFLRRNACQQRLVEIRRRLKMLQQQLPDVITSVRHQ